MLRISLIIAIIAGAAAAGLNFYQVKNVLEQAIAERNDQNTKRDTAEKDAADKKAKLAKTTTELEGTKKKLATTEGELKKQTAKLGDEEKKSKDLAAKLSTVEGDRDKAQRQLAQWDDVHVTPGQVKQLVVDLKNLKEDKEIAMEENKVLMTRYKDLKQAYDEFVGVDNPPPAMPNFHATVIAVDPKYDFVVLNAGKEKGALKRGEVLVNRGGKLVAKLKIFSVESDRCIANVMPNWKQGEVMEGDQVLY